MSEDTKLRLGIFFTIFLGFPLIVGATAGLGYLIAFLSGWSLQAVAVGMFIVLVWFLISCGLAGALSK